MVVYLSFPEIAIVGSGEGRENDARTTIRGDVQRVHQNSVFCKLALEPMSRFAVSMASDSWWPKDGWRPQVFKTSAGILSKLAESCLATILLLCFVSWRRNPSLKKPSETMSVSAPNCPLFDLFLATLPRTCRGIGCAWVRTVYLGLTAAFSAALG